MQQPLYYPYPAGAIPDQLAMYRPPCAAPAQQNPQNAAIPQQTNAQQPAPGGMIWVQGEASAKAYPVAPGATVLLWDSEQPLIYIKTANQFGMPNPMQVLRWENYTPVQQPPPDQGADRIRALEEKYNALAARIDAMSTPPRVMEQEGQNAERAI